jgi:hypothetical protein
VTGTFQVKIPVRNKEGMLFLEENTLAILKARLLAMSPGNRWYPVMVRYLQYIAGRVDGLGGDSTAIKPSYNGVLPVKPTQEPPCEEKPPVKDDCYRNIQCWKIVVWILSAMIFLLFIVVLILLLRR